MVIYQFNKCDFKFVSIFNSVILTFDLVFLML